MQFSFSLPMRARLRFVAAFRGNLISKNLDPRLPIKIPKSVLVQTTTPTLAAATLILMARSIDKGGIGVMFSSECQTATPTKKHFATSKRLPTPSRSTARTLLNPRTSSGSSARPKSVSNQSYPSDSASSRSSSRERFGSRFFDRFTFFSVSVTEYPFFPSGFRPAPFRFPPRFEIILSFFIDSILIIYYSFNQARKNMANKRLSKEKQTLVLMALCEGMPIRACARMYKVGKNTIHRLICETGEAFADYMDRELRDLPCLRIELDEQWQYVGCHKGRMIQPEAGKGDFWLWAAIDADTKLIFSHKIGKRDWITGNTFVKDVSERVSGPVQ